CVASSLTINRSTSVAINNSQDYRGNMAIKKMQRYCLTHGLVLAEKNTPNHILHLLLTLVTVGFWIPVWIAAELFSGRPRCPHCGETTREASYARKAKNRPPQVRITDPH